MPGQEIRIPEMRRMSRHPTSAPPSEFVKRISREEMNELAIHAVRDIDGPEALFLQTRTVRQQPTRSLQRCRSFCITCVASGTVPIVNTSLLRTGDRNLCFDVALEWRFACRE